MGASCWRSGGGPDMQTLPSTAEGLFAGCVIALAIVIAAACGVGASSRIVGIQMPAVGRSRATRILGHRAALWIMIPAFVTAPLLVLVPSDPRLGAGWLVWFAGIGGGALAAMARAQRLVLDEPSQDSPGSETPRRT